MLKLQGAYIPVQIPVCLPSSRRRRNSATSYLSWHWCRKSWSTMLHVCERLKAQYLNRPIGTLSFQLGTIKVRIVIIFFHASCLLTIHFYLACIRMRIQVQISKCKYKPCVPLARVAMSGLISASSLTRLISTAKKIDDFEYSTPSWRCINERKTS